MAKKSPKGKKSIKPHRGRIQAQGGGIEDSESWAQVVPLPLQDGLVRSHTLQSRLPGAEGALRSSAFDAARDFMVRSSVNGGAIAGTVKTFPVPQDMHRRVDIEVWKGKAFV